MTIQLNQYRFYKKIIYIPGLKYNQQIGVSQPNSRTIIFSPMPGFGICGFFTGHTPNPHTQGTEILFFFQSCVTSHEVMLCIRLLG